MGKKRIPDGHRRCGCCHKIKLVAEFYRPRDRQTKATYCWSCGVENMARWSRYVERDPDKVAAKEH